jgi:hypothetical protein
VLRRVPIRLNVRPILLKTISSQPAVKSKPPTDPTILAIMGANRILEEGPEAHTKPPQP